ncbi:hypothetical protein ACFFNY_21250 [Paenibacillus hodogayensis]|uniref:Uncharacterized protein n=1 Tax=Paenibacillus hodogayensis TaxID=279208 RepID=A0ABV5W1A8_9BACL
MFYRQIYGSSQEGEVYYEPWSETRNHLVLRLPPERGQLSLPELAGMCCYGTMAYLKWV